MIIDAHAGYAVRTSAFAASPKKDGLVLINGKSGSMQSYKKIIGFVPQDDIIHGIHFVETWPFEEAERIYRSLLLMTS